MAMAATAVLAATQRGPFDRADVLLGTEDANAGHGEGKVVKYSRSGAGPMGSTKAGRHPTPALTSASKM